MNWLRYRQSQQKKRPARTPAIPNKCMQCRKGRDREIWGNVGRDKQWETELNKEMENKGEIMDADWEIKMGTARSVQENWERQSEEKKRRRKRRQQGREREREQN